MIEEDRPRGEVEGQSAEGLNGTRLGEEPPTVSPAPRVDFPDPPSSSLRAPASDTSTDFAAAAAMAQDILSMEVTDDRAPTRPETGDRSAGGDADNAFGENGQQFDTVNPPPPPNAPLSPDFFTASRPRKRFRRPR